MAKPKNSAYDNPKITDAIVESVRNGNTFQVAALAQGLSSKIISTWMIRSAADDAPPLLVELVERIEQAEAEAEEHHVGIVVEAAKKDYKASQLWLERRRSHNWAKFERHELTGKDGAPLIERKLQNFTEVELRAIAQPFIDERKPKDE